MAGRPHREQMGLISAGRPPAASGASSPKRQIPGERIEQGMVVLVPVVRPLRVQLRDQPSLGRHLNQAAAPG